MSAKSGKPLEAWFGSVAAYIIVTAISVFLGVILGKYIRLEFIRYTGALLFVAIGIMMWLGKI